jgi:GNAT superfamily N-acetyltransferase
MNRTFEELSMNAWPALRTIHHDGWVLRFAGGYTRRANSIHPIYPSVQTGSDEDDQNLNARIQVCEQFYRSQGLKTIFKLAEECFPTGLDECLAGRGYQMDADTSVQTRSLVGWQALSAAEVELSTDCTEVWQAAFCRMGAVAPHNQPISSRILEAILPTRRFASVRVDGEIIACGLGVMQAGFLGLFDIVTDPAHRRKGYGRKVVAGLMTWAAGQGAHTAYLQVMLSNQAALPLYAGLGFQEKYRYWYRVEA